MKFEHPVFDFHGLEGLNLEGITVSIPVRYATQGPSIWQWFPSRSRQAPDGGEVAAMTGGNDRRQ
jgi:hypothetical protein